MEQRPRCPEHALEIFADSALVKDIVKAILHTIFFHRYFTPISPVSRDLLDTTLPAIDDVDLETLIDQRAAALVREITLSSGNGSGRGQLVIQFFEKRRRRQTYFPFGLGGFGGGVGKNGKDEEVCWELWCVDIAVGTPRSEADVIKVRRAMEKSLNKAAFKIVDIVNQEKNHIPPITTTDANPFPYQILVNPKMEGWGQRMSIF